MSKELQLFLLGGATIILNGEPVSGFISAKATALVYYLAATGRSHTREMLAGLLWGDFPEANAKKNLRDVLSNLRRLLDDYLLITRQTVAFNRAVSYWLDSEVFETALHGLRLDAPETWTPTAVTDLRQAMELYKGDFLDGLYVPQAPEFEEWQLLERERLRQLALQGLYYLSLYEARQGNYAVAINYTNRLLALDPWREEAHRQLMRLLAWSGQRSAALSQYEVCRQVLADELGVEPEAETISLYEQIQAGVVGAAPLSTGETLTPVGRPLHNLPAQLTPFIGRETELADLAAQLTDPDCRLLTLVGPGGVGKSRLALRVAESLLPEVMTGRLFPHGIYFVALAPLEAADPAPTLDTEAGHLLTVAIADALKLTFSGQDSSFAQLSSYLSEKSLLLLLDNFEHLLAAAGLLAELLQAAPHLKILTTSRGRLNLRGERIALIRGLSFPKSQVQQHDSWQSYSAVQLFQQTAQTVDPGFVLTADDQSAVTRICQLVDGLPLGIELAATWVRMLTCEEIAREIEHNLGFLATSLRDVPERHRSLWAVFSYSWKLLSADEQQVLRQLSVFRGSFDRDAAVHVACPSLPVLLSLVDNSLVHRVVVHHVGGRRVDSEPGAIRYELLEVLRQYAARMLEQAGDEEAAARDRHSEYYLEFLQVRQAALRGSQQQQALEEIGREIENIRAAWRWAATAVARQDNSARLGIALDSLFHFYDMRSWFQEGADAFQRAAEAVAERPPDAANRLVWGKLLARQGWFTFHLGRQVEARQLLAQSVEILRSLDGPDKSPNLALVFSLNYLAAVHYYLGDYETAQQLCRESLALSQAGGDQYGTAVALNILGQIAHRLGRYEAAREYCQQSLVIEQEIGNRWSLSFSLTNLGRVAFALEDYATASDLFRQSLQIREEMRDLRGAALCLNQLAETAVAQADYDEAERLYQQSLATFREIGNQWGMMTSLAGLGRLAHRQGAYAQAKTYLNDALQRAFSINAIPSVLDILQTIAGLWEQLAQVAQAEQLRHFIQTYPAEGQPALADVVAGVLEDGSAAQTHIKSS